MALQDNFNAIYNRKEQEKNERERQKQLDKNLEIELTENLLLSILDYLEENEKTLLYYPKIKNEIIKNTLQNLTWTRYNKSKYQNNDDIKTFLLLNYDKTTTKALRTYNLTEQKRQKEEKEQQKEAERIQKEEQAKREEQQKAAKKGFNILIMILFAPILILWGILEAIVKKK